MKFDRNFKPELIVSKDPFRGALNFVELDKAENRLCATDGHRLVAVPVQVDEHDTSGPVDSKMLGEARKLAKSAKEDHAEIQCDGALKLTNGATAPRPDRAGMNFPAWRQIMSGVATKSLIAFNAKYLKELAEAIGQEDYVVALAFDPEDPQVPIRVYGTTGFRGNVLAMSDDKAPIAILMPCHLKK